MGCAKAWSPIEMLEDLLREAKSGDIDLTGAIVIIPTNSNADLVSALIRKAGVDADDELLLLRSAFKQSAGL